MSEQLSQLRQREFARLDEAGHVYLDYTGGGLYAASQLDAHLHMLQHSILGNPHSENPSSLASTDHIEATRQRILDFFDAPQDEYEVIFTLNASGALKLVGESYPFEEGSRYVLIADNHNSVNGIREFAVSKGASVDYVPLGNDLRVDPATLETILDGADPTTANLFSYPAQSNFSGVKHALDWIERAHALGYDVLLDAAAYAPTNPLSLREVKPDFVSLSFYKMFGYPTGVGALLARRKALAKLVRPWFAGGTVRFVSTQNQTERLLHLSGEAFEDGTLNYLHIPAVKTGLDFLDEVGVGAIQAHVAHLTEMLLTGLSSLTHTNGEPITRIYGPHETTGRGGTVAFNVLDPQGDEVDFKVVEQRANEWNISIRTGCFCNPGAAESAFDYVAQEAYACFNEMTPADFTLQQFSVCLHNMPVGAVRVSVGLPTNEADVNTFLKLMASFVDCDPAPISQRELPDVVGG